MTGLEINYYLPDDSSSNEEKLFQPLELSRRKAAQTLRFCRIFLDMLGVEHALPESLSAVGSDYAQEVDRLMQEALFFLHQVREILPVLVKYNPRLNCLYKIDPSAPPLTNIQLMIRDKDFGLVAESLLVATRQAISDSLSQRAKDLQTTNRIDFQIYPELARELAGQIQELVVVSRLLQDEDLSFPQLVTMLPVLKQEQILPLNNRIGKAGETKAEFAALLPILGLIILLGGIGLSQVDFNPQPIFALTEKIYTDPDEAREAVEVYLEDNWAEAVRMAFNGHEITAEVEAMIHTYKEQLIQETLNRIVKTVDMEVDIRGRVDLNQTNLGLTMVGSKKDTLEISFPDGYKAEQSLKPFELVDGNGHPELYARVNKRGFLCYLLVFQLENLDTDAGYCATLLVERTGQSWRDAEVKIHRGTLGDMITDQFDKLDNSEPIAKRLASDGWTPVTQDQDGNVALLGLETDLYRQTQFMISALQSKLVEIAESGLIPENSTCLSSPEMQRIHHELALSSTPVEGLYFEAKAGAELQVLAYNWVEKNMEVRQTTTIPLGDCGQIFESRHDVHNYLKDYVVTSAAKNKATILQIGTKRYLVVGVRHPILAEDQHCIFIDVIPYEQVLVRGK